MTDIDALSPDDLVDLSLQLVDDGELAAAQIAQMKAVGKAPDNARAHVALAETLLRRGDYTAGFREHEWRTHIDPSADWQSPTPQWTGYTLPNTGRLLIVADQGFGDTLMFGRYIRWCRQFCDRIALGVSPEMLSLFGHDTRANRARDYAVFSDWQDAPSHCAHTRLSSLPLLHATTLKTIPRPISSAELTLWMAPLWIAHLINGRRDHGLIGFCWRGREENESQIERSVPFDLIRSLIELPGMVPVCLQHGASHTELMAFPPQPRLGFDWAETAGLISHLDAVVTSDTAIAHMAGTLGIPTYVLLKKVPDWRYGAHSDTNPWYLSHRLVRQQHRGDWGTVIDEVRERLRHSLAPE